jgi:SAM-dependent methyltransferase
MFNMPYDGSINEKEKRDISAWDHHREFDLANKADFFEHRIQKISELKIFTKDIGKFRDIFQSAGTILEIGGGSCWGSHYIKRLFPSARVIGSDIAPAAIKSHAIWRDFFGVAIDEIYVCRSYEVPVEDASVDLVFCFEAAHHFGRHRQTLKELQRIVRPGGHVVYLNEPVCSPLVYRLAHRRVNRRLEIDGVPEDVLLYGKILELGIENGFVGRLFFDPHIQNRGPVETMYYACLSRMPFLQRWLPTTGHFVFEKQ